MKEIKKIVNGRIIANIEIAPSHCLMQIEAPEITQTARAGQFVNVQVKKHPGITDPLLRIPLSICSIGSTDIKLLYKVVGTGTELLKGRKAGELINILGPLGNGFELNIIDQQSEAVLVGGGCGIAPIYALAEELTKNKRPPAQVFLGAKQQDQILCEQEFKGLGHQVHIATEDGSSGTKGFITELVKEYLRANNVKNIIVYGCGPQPMLNALMQITNALQIPTYLSLEAYMACGIGACRGCAVKTNEAYKLCCTDGPVFNANLLW